MERPAVPRFFDPTHGGSFPSLAWNSFFSEKLMLDLRGGKFCVYIAGSDGPLLVMLHGGGYSGLTWSLCAAQVKGCCTVAAYDCRGHGETRTAHDDDLATDTLVEDALAVVHALHARRAQPVVLVGHSMGGAIAVRAAATGRVPDLAGLVVIDVVEGTALAALKYMQDVLARRPKRFATLQEAVDWALRSGAVHSPASAQISIPSQLVQRPEDGEYAWRTDLEATQPFWQGWFEGLSGQFLSISAPKLLILAGTDRLDKELTVGQMQGKFQLVVMRGCGHVVHEDDPGRVARTLHEFVARLGLLSAGGAAGGGEEAILAARLARARAMRPVVPQRGSTGGDEGPGRG